MIRDGGLNLRLDEHDDFALGKSDVFNLGGLRYFLLVLNHAKQMQLQNFFGALECLTKIIGARKTAGQVGELNRNTFVLSCKNPGNL